MALALALAVAALPRAARADDGDPKQACVAAYTDGQRARNRAALKEAHEKLLICARDPCPQVLRPECVQWLNDVEQRLPSIVLEARDARGNDLTQVRVTIDGAPATDKLDGRAIDLDPGEHALRFEAAGQTAEQTILLGEGQKRRRVSVQLGAAQKPPPPPPPPPPKASTPRIGWPVIGLGALGVVGLGGFTIFGLSGVSMQSDLDKCRPGCDPSRVDDVKRTYLVADVSLVVGVLALGAAALLFATSQPTSTTQRGTALAEWP